MENMIDIIMMIALLFGVICKEPDFCFSAPIKLLLGRSCSKIKRKRTIIITTFIIQCKGKACKS